MMGLKRLKIRLFNRLIRVSDNHKSARKAVSTILLMELNGIKWYSPLWHFKITKRILGNLFRTIKKEMRGYQDPIFHVNPKVIICEDFSCLRSDDGGCNPGEFTSKCHECCFGVKQNDVGELISTWIDAYGKPTWLELSCRDCQYFQSSCKGIHPKLIEEIKTHRFPNVLPEYPVA